MAKAISNEELQLRKRARRRLVGAIALVVMVVVFVPMVLENEPKPVSQDISINIPPPSVDADDAAASTSDSGPLRFRPVEQPPAGRAIDESPPPAQSAAVGQQAPSAASEPPAPDEPASSSAPESPRAAVEQSFVVQLGAFSNARNATRLAAKVRENRFDAYTEVVDTTGGKRTRVRVGPYPTRAAAEQARDRLKARKLTYGEPVIVSVTD
ncbi:MAG: SPOR domain-containing protein [Betaproteobacteria bacterium]|nr:MAG: SPOR domain-containing protein [Betaproteobacteria bacterium]